jgi:RND family efflux transporter MFP subunit
LKRLAFVVLALVGVAGCKHEEPEREPPKVRVTCVAATLGSWTDRVDLRGLVSASPDKHAMVSAQVAGRITKLLVREGDHLDKGGVIAELERQPLDDVLVQSEAQVTQADIAVKNAELARKRAEHLVETGVGSRQQLDDETARYQTAVSAATAARAASAVSRRSVTRTSVASPIAGVVIRILRRTGELVDGTSGTAVAELADPTALELTASCGAADIVRLAPGQHADVRFSILGDAGADGEVRAVAPAVDPITGLGSVRLGLTPKGARLPLGVFGEATVSVGARANVVTLPKGALRTGPDGRPEAVVCDGATAKTRALRVGARAQDRVEIVEGVAAGERVIADAALGVEDGAALEVAP